ncbi:hypothetical protein ACFQX6_42165 [Streptosporangium lutulentum]
MTMMGGGSVFGGAGNAPGLPFAGVPQEMQAASTPSSPTNRNTSPNRWSSAIGAVSGIGVR